MAPDILAPDFDGLEVMRQIRDGSPRVCVLFLTASDAAGDRAAATTGGDGNVTKPFSP